MHGATFTVTIEPSLSLILKEVSRTATTVPVVETEGKFTGLLVLLPPHQLDQLDELLDELLPDDDELPAELDASRMLLYTLLPLTTEEKLKGYRAVTEPV